MKAGTINETMAVSQLNINDTINDYSKRLLGFIRKRVTNEADAEDILQDVFYQLSIITEPIEQLTGWLFRVARNKIIDRKRKMQPVLIEDTFSTNEENETSGWEDIFFDAGNTPEAEYLKTIFWETLDEALKELPEEQRKVFVMNEMEGIPFKDISAQTGESINTLLSRKRYAVLHLRNRLSVLHDELINY